RSRAKARDHWPCATGERRDRGGTGTQRLSVHLDGARAALRDAASVLGASEPELLADDPQQRSIRIAVKIAPRAVDVERDGHIKLLCKEGRRAGLGRQSAGQAAPESIHAAIKTPSWACLPGAGSRLPPGRHAQPTSESCAMCSWMAASVLPPLRFGSLICSQI